MLTLSLFRFMSHNIAIHFVAVAVAVFDLVFSFEHVFIYSRIPILFYLLVFSLHTCHLYIRWMLIFLFIHFWFLWTYIYSWFFSYYYHNRILVSIRLMETRLILFCLIWFDFVLFCLCLRMPSLYNESFLLLSLIAIYKSIIKTVVFCAIWSYTHICPGIKDTSYWKDNRYTVKEEEERKEWMISWLVHTQTIMCTNCAIQSIPIHSISLVLFYSVCLQFFKTCISLRNGDGTRKLKLYVLTWTEFLFQTVWSIFIAIIQIEV